MKGVIKLELGNYNSIPTFTAIAPPTESLKVVPSSLLKIEPKIKQEQQQVQNAGIAYLNDNQNQENSLGEQQTKQQEDQMEDLYHDLLKSASWECPCGQKVNGPIQYFQHVKKNHEYDTLQRLIQQKTIRRVMQLYPPICQDEINIIQQLDAADPKQLLKELAAKREHLLRQTETPELIVGEPGTFGDLASRFIEQLPKGSPEVSIMLHFFSFLHEYVISQISSQGKSNPWCQQSPNQILKQSNRIYEYYCLSCQQKEYPFQKQDVKKVIYLLSKWMFLKRWTNDRIFYALQQINQDEDNQSQSKKGTQIHEHRIQNEGIVSKREYIEDQ